MIDIVHQINEVQRTVGTTTLDAGEARIVTISQTYDAAIDDVWDACTNAERIPRWFLPISGNLEVGGRYQLEGNAGGTIERCEPPRLFAVTWEFGDTTTWLTVRLHDEGEERTRVELEHTVPVDDHWEQFGPGAVGVGWDLGMIGLGMHLQSGEPVDHDEVTAWTVSDDGKRFMAMSSDGWYQANVAAGSDVEDARAKAERTSAAYTGAP